MDKFGKMQIRRWKRMYDADTIFVCSVHGGQFDVELGPCDKCWEEKGCEVDNRKGD